MDIFPNKSLRLKINCIDRYIKAAVDSVLESDIFGIFRRPFYTASAFTLKADVATVFLPDGVKNTVATLAENQPDPPSQAGSVDAIDADDVILSLDNSPEEIGAGLRLALSRCR